MYFIVMHHENTRVIYTPSQLTLYSKTGVYRRRHVCYFCSKTNIVGTRKNRLNEAVLT